MRSAAIVPTTTTSETGNRGANRRPRRMLATTKIDRAVVCGLSAGAPRTTSQSCPSVLVRNDVDAEHATEHRDADLNPDAGQKPD